MEISHPATARTCFGNSRLDSDGAQFRGSQTGQRTAKRTDGGSCGTQHNRLTEQSKRKQTGKQSTHTYTHIHQQEIQKQTHPVGQTEKNARKREMAVASVALFFQSAVPVTHTDTSPQPPKSGRPIHKKTRKPVAPTPCPSERGTQRQQQRTNDPTHARGNGTGSVTRTRRTEAAALY
jgi:hypothetical protein